MAVGVKGDEPVFSSQVERAILVTAIASVIVFAGAVTWANVHNIDIGLVSKRSLDEYAFTFVLTRMYEGLLALNPRVFFNITFFNYGFPYFFLQLILTIPAQIAHSYGAMLIIERSFSLAWAIGVLVLSAGWIRHRTGSWVYALLVIWLLISMPGFVNTTTIAHPDSMMNFFLLAALIVAAELNSTRWRDVVIVGVLCGLGACAKIQIAMYVPFVGALLGWRAMLERDGRGDFRKRLVLSASKAGIVVLLTPVIYLVLNPFLVHPTAFRAFVQLFLDNLDSNATNHLHFVLPTAAAKLNMLSHYYFPISLVSVLATVAVLAATWRNVQPVKIAPELVMLCCGFITGLYIFLTVQKTWDSYYVSSFTLLTVSLVSLWGRITLPGPLSAPARLGIALATALALVATRTPAAVASPIVDDGPGARASASVVSLMSGVLEHLARPRVLTSPDTPFQFQKVGLRLTQVTFITTGLSDELLNAADVIVIRKNDSYFDPAQLNQDNPLGPVLRQSRARIDSVRAGRDKDFLFCAENAVVMMLCRRSTYSVSQP